jgi:D-alanyl-D-alanine carboxypeptidase/D-alanyl-D-alanine-endopeptidase (penicillin-binding protein 4)
MTFFDPKSIQSHYRKGITLLIGLMVIIWGGLMEPHSMVVASTSQKNSLLELTQNSPQLQKISQGILVTRIRDHKTLFEKNPDLLLSPASVTKVATSAAALAKFSPIGTFKTRFYRTGPLKNGILQGHLVVVGDGDPLLISEKLWQMAADFKNMGIREISGSLVIDQSLFDQETRDEGRLGTAKATRNAYDAPITALGVNFNAIALTVAPGDSLNQNALLSLDPYPLPHVQIQGQVQTGGPQTPKSLQVKRTLDGTGTLEVISASGSIAQDEGIAKVYRSVSNPTLTSGETIKAFLKKEGVIVKGPVKTGPRPKDSELVYELESYEMRRLVSGLNTFSNNYIADVLVKRMGAEFPPKGAPLAAGQGSYTNGLQVLKDFLINQVGIKGAFQLENGSGLDTDNRLSSRQVVDILLYMERRMDLFPDFLASLPATGWDGTMKKRFKDKDIVDLKGMFRAKSGTLTEPLMVSALAGYFRHDQHGWVAFCVIENGKAGSQQPAIVDARKRQDSILAAMLHEL